MYMKPDLIFDKTIAEKLGYSNFQVSGKTGLLWGTKDGQEWPIQHFHKDMNAAWWLFENDNIKLELGKYPDGRVSASFWDKVWFTHVGENPAHATALAWLDRELWREANEQIVR